MIEEIYEDYFYYPDGSRKSYFRMRSPCSKEIVIQHPLPAFDPRNNKIYREEYELVYSNNDLIGDFIRLTEVNSNIRDDEILFWNTGYWSILDTDYQYIGCSESALLNTLKNIQQGKLVFCLCSRDFIIFIKNTIIKKQISDKSTIDVFSTNTYLPFAEVLDPFREVFKMMGDMHLKKTEKMNYSTIRNGPLRIERNKNVIVPHAIAPIRKRKASGRKTIGLVVIPNDFGPFKIDYINSLEYILTRGRGGSLKSDFFRPWGFCYKYFVEFYDDVVFLYGFYDVFGDKTEFLSNDDFEINETYLDYFDI